MFLIWPLHTHSVKGEENDRACCHTSVTPVLGKQKEREGEGEINRDRDREDERDRDVEKGVQQRE